MGTYWEAFIEEYKDYLHQHSLVVILQAFYSYCNGEKRKSDKILVIKPVLEPRPPVGNFIKMKYLEEGDMFEYGDMEFIVLKKEPFRVTAKEKEYLDSLKYNDETEVYLIQRIGN